MVTVSRTNSQRSPPRRMGMPRHPLPETDPRLRHRRPPQAHRRRRSCLVAVPTTHLPLARSTQRPRLHPRRSAKNPASPAATAPSSPRPAPDAPSFANGSTPPSPTSATSAASSSSNWSSPPTATSTSPRCSNQQRSHIEQLTEALHEQDGEAGDPTDVVALWRRESSSAALRFLQRFSTCRPSPIR